MPIVYRYSKCSTCRDALKWLDARGIAYEVKEIRETPPTRTELEIALKAAGGNMRKIFKTSGMDYRALKLKDLLPAMKDEEALALLERNGNLVKRPFVTGDGVSLVGFKESEWSSEFIPPDA